MALGPLATTTQTDLPAPSLAAPIATSFASRNTSRPIVVAIVMATTPQGCPHRPCSSVIRLTSWVSNRILHAMHDRGDNFHAASEGERDASHHCFAAHREWWGQDWAAARGASGCQL